MIAATTPDRRGEGETCAARPRARRPVFPPVLLLAALVLAAPAHARDSSAPDVLVGVRAEGSRRITSEVVVSQSGLVVGHPLDAVAARAAVEKLFRTGQYARVAVLAEPVEGGVVAVVRVEEHPVVSEVRFDGEDKLKEKDLLEKTAVAAGDVLRPSALFKTEKAIRELYAEKGYPLATVAHRVDPDGSGRAALTFDISEGKKVRVKTITIRGLARFKPGPVRKSMKTKPDSWLRSGEFKRDVYEEDLTRVARYLRDRGCADAEVTADSVWTAADGRDIFIDITVAEGPIYTFGRVTARGSALFPPEKLVAAAGLEIGGTYSEKDFEEALSNVFALFAEEGYIYANVAPEKTKRGGAIDIAFAVTDGPPAHVNRVLISGNTKTKERVIRRELVIYPGDLFRRSAILRSQREIFQLGYFQDIQLKDEPVRGTNDINLTFDVVEKETGEASMGAGFSSQNGATGFVRLGESNLFGNGQRANLLWEFGNLTQVEISFTEPWLFGSRTSAGVDISSVRRNLDTFFDHRRGGGIRLGRPVPWLDYSRVDWSYRLEEREIEARSGASQAVLDAEGSNLSSAMRIALSRSSTDRPVHPTTGSVAIVSAELAGGPLGGDVEFVQNEVESRWYYPTWWRFVLGLRARVGSLDGLGDRGDVPIYERYRLGGTGPYGLRGYGDRDVVPAGNALDVGGRSMVVFSAEYKFPVVESVYGLFFADAGNTWNSFREVRLGELNRGAGFGVRFEIPLLGQLGFDLGYGFDTGAATGRSRRGWEPHFQLGSLF
jgi:outer membrane protein insertion porin family